MCKNCDVLVACSLSLSGELEGELVIVWIGAWISWSAGVQG